MILLDIVLMLVLLVASPVRLIDDISPVKGSNNKALNCGPNAKKAELVADAKPGSSLAFSWFAGGGENVSPPCILSGFVLTHTPHCSGHITLVP